MDPMTSHLDRQFGSFPEPVLLLSGGQAVYSNEPGQQLLEQPDFPTDLLLAPLPHAAGTATPWRSPWGSIPTG